MKLKESKECMKLSISNILSKIWVVKGTNIMRILQLDGIAKKNEEKKDS